MLRGADEETKKSKSKRTNLKRPHFSNLLYHSPSLPLLHQANEFVLQTNKTKQTKQNKTTFNKNERTKNKEQNDKKKKQAQSSVAF